jgi:L-glyceraldehyde 3-phosphate reductase
MGLEYVDIFYSHRPDPNTPLEETMMALDQIVRQGKALYVGLSNYPAERTAEAAKILRELGTPCLIHQPKYSMFERWVEGGLLDTLEQEGIGCIPFSPLAQGLLTDKYLNGIPEGSRAAKSWGFLKPDQVYPAIEKVKLLNELALQRSQTLAQMALAWILKDHRITSVLVGASSVKQIEDNVAAIKNLNFTEEELQQIERILQGEHVYIAPKVTPRNLSNAVPKMKEILSKKTENQFIDTTRAKSRTDFIKGLAQKLGGQDE